MKKILSRPFVSRFMFNKRHNSGQAVIEYVLLLVIVVGIAFLITNLLASRNPESPGFLISFWQQVLNFIGQDIPDKVTP